MRAHCTPGAMGTLRPASGCGPSTYCKRRGADGNASPSAVTVGVVGTSAGLGTVIARVSCGLLAERGNSTMRLGSRNLARASAFVVLVALAGTLPAQAAPKDAKEKALVSHVA